MASIPAPVSLPSPVTWWQNPKTRARLIAAAVLAAAYLLGLAYGSWTRVCAGEQHLSGGDQSREDAHPQAQGSPGRGRDRAQLPQGYDSPVVPEPDQPRGGCPWRGSGGADLLRQARAPAERRGSSNPGGAPQA